MNRIIVISASALLLASCVEKGNDDVVSKHKVVFEAKSESFQTKSQEAGEDTLLEEIELGEDEGVLSVFGNVCDSPAVDFGTEGQTKGATVVASSLNKAGNHICLNALVDKVSVFATWLSDLHYITDVPLSYSGSGWSSADVFWLKNIKTNFWATFPATIEAGHGSLTYEWPNSLLAKIASDYNPATVSVTYNMPEPGTDSQDATRTEDILFAYNSDKFSGSGTPDKVSMSFKHSLASIRFNISGVTAEGVTIKSVSLIDIYGSAKCELDGKSGSLTCNWSSFGEKKTYVQAISADDYQDGAQKETSSAIFHVIPQAASASGAKLGITIVRADGSEQTVSVSLSDTWVAGKYYTYKIKYTTPDKLSISVTDSATGTGIKGNTKTSLVIKNTGNVKCYVRAAIIANWVDASGNIIAPWDETQGTFAGYPGTGWILGPDGFWYYSAPVEAGAATGTPLFTSYTVPSVPSVADHLKMTVFAQSVQCDSRDDAWGGAVVSSSAQDYVVEEWTDLTVL